jgi:ATP-dependent Clp protease ATP-binding subunit ClpC
MSADVRFTDQARKVMQLANAAAQRRKHEYIGTEHILLGLIDEGSGVAVHVLGKLGIDPNELAARVTQVLQAGPDINIGWKGERPHTPRAKNVVELAIQSSKELGHDYVGTEHILLGLIKEKDGVAGQVLRELITPEDVCAVLQRADQPLPSEDLSI